MLEETRMVLVLSIHQVSLGSGFGDFKIVTFDSNQFYVPGQIVQFWIRGGPTFFPQDILVQVRQCTAITAAIESTSLHTNTVATTA